MVDKHKVVKTVKGIKSAYEYYILNHAETTEQAVRIIRELRYEASEDRRMEKENERYLKTVFIKNEENYINWED